MARYTDLSVNTVQMENMETTSYHAHPVPPSFVPYPLNFISLYHPFPYHPIPTPYNYHQHPLIPMDPFLSPHLVNTLSETGSGKVQMSIYHCFVYYWASELRTHDPIFILDLHVLIITYRHLVVNRSETRRVQISVDPSVLIYHKISTNITIYLQSKTGPLLFINKTVSDHINFVAIFWEFGVILPIAIKQSECASIHRFQSHFVHKTTHTYSPTHFTTPPHTWMCHWEG